MRTRRVISREEAAALDLAARVRIEQAITDAKAAEHQHRQTVAADLQAYADWSPWRRYMFQCLGDVSGKVVLDLGCGYHPTPIHLAAAGARRVYACDISEKAVSHIRRLADAGGLRERVVTLVCAGEQLPLPTGHVDLVHGEAVLHHLDIPQAAREISRVLHEDGVAVFKDPLGHNALLELARDYLKHSAKATDRPLRVEHIEEFGRAFRSCSYRGFGAAAILAGAFFNRSRWPRVTRVVDGIDAAVLGAVSPLERYCQYVVTCVRK